MTKNELSGRHLDAAGKMTPPRKIYLELSFNMDVWEDAADELMVEDAFENNSVKSGVGVKIVDLKGINPEAVGDLLETLKQMVNDFEVFANVPENYKEMNGWPGDENPRTTVMLKAIKLIEKAKL